MQPTTIVSPPGITLLKPRIAVIGVGGGGGNAVNNMIVHDLEGAEFIVANTDAQALSMSKAPRLIQLGPTVTEGLGAGSLADIGQAAAEESIDEIMDHLHGTHMCFVTAGMGGRNGNRCRTRYRPCYAQGRHTDGRRRHHAIHIRRYPANANSAAGNRASQ